MKKNSGFSLVELIIVIAIMAILAAAILPALIHYIDKAKKSDDIAAADGIATSFEACIANDDYSAAISNIQRTGTGNIDCLLISTEGDTGWTNYTTLSGTSNDDTDTIDDLISELNQTCPPPALKYRKSVNPQNVPAGYILGSGSYDANGWAVAINSKGEICVFITDGTKSNAVKGVSVNPIKCSEYK